MPETVGGPQIHAALTRDDAWFWSFGAAVLRSRYLIVGSALVLGLAVGLFTYLRPRNYVASASFTPQEPAGTPQGSLGQIAAQFGLGATRGMTNSAQFYADLVQSREILRAVILRPYNAPGAQGVNGNLLRYLRLERDSNAYTMSKALEKVQSFMSVRLNRPTNVVSFEVWTRNPELSRQIVNELLAQLNEYNLRRRQSQARAEREFVEQRLREAQRELNEAERKYGDFLSSNRRFGAASTLTATEARLQREITLRQQVYTTLASNFESSRIEEVRSTPVMTVLERPEGFVHPKPRGTVRKAIIGALVGATLGIIVAMLRDYLSKARQLPAGDYHEFSRLWRAALDDFRPWRRRSA